MLTLETTPRDTFGKSLNMSRKAGKLPVVVYGPKDETVSLFVDRVSFEKIWKEAGESTVVSLVTSTGKKDVLIQEVDEDPVRRVPRHVDFYAIEAGKMVQVSVELVFTGESPAVKTLGATLVKVIHELEVEAMPKDLPHELSIDIGSLITLEDTIHAKDVPLPSGVSLITDDLEVVASVAEQKADEEPEADLDIASIEVEKKGKKEDDEVAAKA